MSSKKQNGLKHGTIINQMMKLIIKLKNILIKLIEFKISILMKLKNILLIIFMWLLISGCCGETPAPPSDYIDEVDMDTFALSSNSS